MSNQQWGPPPGQQTQYPPQQYQQSFGWGQVPPPPKKKRGAAVVLGILGGLVVLGVAGFAIASFAVKNNEPTVTHPVAVPTDGPATEEPGPFPTTRATVPTAPASTRQPVPTKTTRPQLTANQIVTANPFYRTGLQRPTGCRESPAGLGTAANAQRYYRSIKACLDRAWPRQIAAAGFKFRAPGLVQFSGTANSPCGSTSDGRAFYCSGSHMIYMQVATDVARYKQDAVFGRAAASFTVAHEYAHSLQSMTRILSATSALQYDANAAKELELNRRLELQASCLGDVFLGTNKGSYGLKGRLYADWLYIVNGSGDENAPGGPRDHGSRASHGYWGRVGFAARNPAACNTYVASAKKVS